MEEQNNSEQNYSNTEQSNGQSSKESFFSKTRKKTENLFGKSRESVDQLRNNVQSSLESNENEKFYASFAYIPLLGPLVCFLFKRKQRLTFIHAKNSSYMQFSMIILLFIIWLLNNIPGISHLLKMIMFSPIITNAILYIGAVLYLVGSVYGAVKANERKPWVVPYLYETMEKFFSSANKDDARGTSDE